MYIYFPAKRYGFPRRRNVSFFPIINRLLLAQTSLKKQEPSCYFWFSISLLQFPPLSVFLQMREMLFYNLAYTQVFTSAINNASLQSVRFFKQIADCSWVQYFSFSGIVGVTFLQRSQKFYLIRVILEYFFIRPSGTSLEVTFIWNACQTSSN